MFGLSHDIIKMLTQHIWTFVLTNYNYKMILYAIFGKRYNSLFKEVSSGEIIFNENNEDEAFI